jgi:hypothetical protein
MVLGGLDDLSGRCSKRRYPALYQGRFSPSASGSLAPQSADFCRMLGALVIDVSPDARHDGTRRPRRVRWTVCLA